MIREKFRFGSVPVPAEKAGRGIGPWRNSTSFHKERRIPLPQI
jgi:hypothetical protein